MWAACAATTPTERGAKRDGVVELQLLEHFREDLNKRAPRAMVVLRPLEVVLQNCIESQIEEVDAVNNPEDASAGTRTVPFSRMLYIEHDDFSEGAPTRYFRLALGREVECDIPASEMCRGNEGFPHGHRGGITVHLGSHHEGQSAQERRNVRATIHWVSDAHAVEAEVRLYNGPRRSYARR